VKILPILIALLLLTSQLCPAQQLSKASENSLMPWKTWKESSQQSVSYRSVTVDNSSDTDNDIATRQLIEIKATAKVNSSLSSFLLFIQDVENTPNWLVNANKSKIIKQYSATENSFYITLFKIWPMQARVLLLHSTYWQNPDLSIEINLVDDMFNLNEPAEFIADLKLNEYLPVKIHSAHWKIIPTLIINNDKPQGQTELFIEYIFVADGRGDTAKWLADHLALKSIWKSMRNIRRQLPDEKWQQQTVKGITELSTIPLTEKP
jgi:hypothetical protein